MSNHKPIPMKECPGELGKKDAEQESTATGDERAAEVERLEPVKTIQER